MTPFTKSLVDSHDSNRRGHLARVVLRIAVGIKDELLRRVLEPRAQRTTVAAVHGMMNYLELGDDRLELREHLGGVVRASVVDDDDLQVVDDAASRQSRP